MRTIITIAFILITGCSAPLKNELGCSVVKKDREHAVDIYLCSDGSYIMEAKSKQ